MQFDGPLEPQTIIIGIPISILSMFSLQYIELGMTTAEADIEARNFIRARIQQYIPAGSPYIIVDEDNEVWDTIPIGQLVDKPQATI